MLKVKKRMNNKIKLLKLKVGEHDQVFAPTYEDVVNKINELIKLTDQRTKERDAQIKELVIAIKSLDKQVKKIKKR